MPVNPQPRGRVRACSPIPTSASLPQVPDLAVICTPRPRVPGLIARARRARHARRRRADRRALDAEGGDAGRIARAGHARRGPAAPAAHPRPQLPRAAGAGHRAQRQLRAHRRAARAARLRLAVRRAVHRGARLGRVAAASASRTSSRSATAPTSTSATCSTTSAAIRDRAPSCSTSNRSRAARKFMSAARAAARNKPVIAIKAGRGAGRARAAASHTGALAGADDVYDAAFRRAGMLRVYELDELFDAVETLARARPLSGDRLAILTNGGGLGRAGDRRADRRRAASGRARAGDAARASTPCCPPTWSRGNPVDIIGDAPARALCPERGDPARGSRRRRHPVHACADRHRAEQHARGSGRARRSRDDASATCSPAGSAEAPAEARAACSPRPACPPTRRRKRRCAPSCTWSTTAATRSC